MDFDASSIVLMVLLLIAFFATMCYSNDNFHNMIKEGYDRIEDMFGGWKSLEHRKGYPVPQGNLPQNPYGMNNRQEIDTLERNVGKNVVSVNLPKQRVPNELAQLYK